jgi:hypothetical protein
MFLWLINHAHQPKLAAATKENHLFPYKNYTFAMFTAGLVPNIRYWPNIR